MYQDLQNYRSTTNGTREAREKHERSTPINNNGMKGKNVNNVNRVNKFFNKNFSQNVNSKFDEFIRQEEDDMKRPFNPTRLKKEIEKLLIIAPTEREQIEVIKKAIKTGWQTFEPLTEKEKSEIENYE
jgi:hypothetical protein